MYRRAAVLPIAAVLRAGTSISAQVIQAGGEGLRYLNPLVMENPGRLADPTVIKFQGKYYLYLTGGLSPGGRSGAAVWSSHDLVRWEHHELSIPEGRGIAAPTAFEYDRYVHLTGNDIGLFRSNEQFKHIPEIQTPYESPDCKSNSHLYILLLDPQHLDTNRSELIKQLSRRRIRTQLRHIPVHTQPFYQKNLEARRGDCPNAEGYHQQCPSLPLFSSITHHEAERMVTVINDLIKVNPLH